jgi:branched-subunit amino acid aminotransferase/4-amino-4-deoxychorismate lyase
MLNRGQRYGDGFFDTMLLLEGQPVWSLAHWERMASAAKILGFHWPDSISLSAMEISYDAWIRVIRKEWEQGGRPGRARVRTVVWRSGDGDYLPLTTQSEWQITVQPLHSPAHHPLGVGPSPVVQCPAVIPWFKSLSAMPYVLAARFAANKGWDDALLVNSRGEFIESSRSNLFYWMNGCCYTPSVSEGCLPGIAARFLIQFLASRGHKIHYANASDSILREASGIWLTNSLRGVLRVHQWNHDPLPVDPYADLADAANAEIRGNAEMQGGSEFL